MMMRSLFPLALYALAFLDLASAQRQSERIAPTHGDVVYMEGTEANVLDLWIAESEEPTPLAVYIHGGGFRAGSKNGVSMGAVRKFLDAGISVASVEYRFVPEFKLPVAHHDCRRALQFLRSKAKTWNFDKKKIGAWGGSAGAQLSMYLGFHDEMADRESEDRVARQSTRLACVATRGGQATMDLDVWMKWVPGYDVHHRDLGEYFGELSVEEHAAVVAEVSAIELLSRGDPPIFMTYGMAPSDPIPEGPKAGGWKVHHVVFGEKLKEKMDGLGIENHLVYPGAKGEYGGFEEFFIAKLKE
jgi:acetyl esterase/lipase